MRRAVRAATGLLAGVLGGCAIHDSRLAERAQTRLLGIDELDLETCFGAPDQRVHDGATDILTWATASASSSSWSLPVIQGPTFSNGGDCHVSVRFDRRVATRVVYTGEKNALLAPDAYCAPVLRTCMALLDGLARAPGRVAGDAAPTGRTRAGSAPAG